MVLLVFVSSFQLDVLVSRLLHFSNFPTAKTNRNARLLHFSHFQTAKKRAGTQNGYIFSHFQTVQTSGNTRLPHFFKNEQEHETVAFFHTSLAAKTSGNTRLPHFFAFVDSKNERERETAAFFTFLDSKNEGECETVTFSFPDSTNELEHENAAFFFYISRQEKQTETRDCRIFSHFQTANTSRNTKQLQISHL